MLNAVSSAAAQDVFHRMSDDLLARLSGPLHLRFLLQPLMASIFAVRDGIKDGKTGRSPYFWTVLSNPEKRRERLREGLAAIGKVLALAVLLDTVYQYLELKTFYPVEAIVVAVSLAFIPYLIVRGPVARIVRWRDARSLSGRVS
jgi:hypothetical protein